MELIMIREQVAQQVRQMPTDPTVVSCGVAFPGDLLMATGSL